MSYFRNRAHAGIRFFEDFGALTTHMNRLRGQKFQSLPITYLCEKHRSGDTLRLIPGTPNHSKQLRDRLSA